MINNIFNSVGSNWKKYFWAFCEMIITTMCYFYLISATVKQSSELTVGVLTQCIKSKTMSRMNPSTASNIMLKINSKLNGINHTLKNK